MVADWIPIAQTNPHRMNFIMPFTLKQLGDVTGKAVEDFEGTVKEISRVLKPSGKLFASVCHPCFHTSGGIGRQGTGIDKEVVVSNYYKPTEWEAPLHTGKVKVIWRHRTLEDYVKTFIKSGLTIVDLHEPIPTEEQAAIDVGIAWMQKIPIFLFWELKK